MSRRGRGESVTLTADADTLAHYALGLEVYGETWLDQCEHPSTRSEARAMLAAVKKIRAAIAQATGEGN